MRLLDDLLAVLARLREQLLSVPHDPPSALDLFRQPFLHLGDQLEDLVAVDEHGRGQRHRLRLSHELVELLESGREVHQRSSNRSSSAVRTWSGTSPETFPPSWATSFTSEDERKDHFGLVGMNSVSTPASRWFICAIWISYS